MLVNRAKANTTTTGTGAVTLGSAVSPYQSWSASGAVAGVSYSYLIEDGTAWEVGVGLYNGTTLTRPGPGSDLQFASSTGALLNLSGAATVGCVANKNDFGGPSANLRKLADTTLGADGTTISFASINQNYDDLVLVIYPVFAGNAANNTITVQFNGDTGLNYDWRLWSTFENNQSLNQAGAQIGWAGYQATNQGPLEATIFNYATTGEKHVRSAIDVAGGGNYFTRFFNAWWHPATPAAINSMSIVCSTNFKAGTRAVLYGRGGATAAALTSGAPVLLSAQNVSGVASVVFDNTVISSLYSNYLLRFTNLVGTVAGFLIGQLSPDNGTTLRTTGYVTSYENWGLTTNFSQYIEAGITNGVPISVVNTDTTMLAHGEARLWGPSVAGSRTALQSNSITKGGDNNYYDNRGAGVYNTAEGHNYLKVLAASGNISGNFQLYGMP